MKNKFLAFREVIGPYRGTAVVMLVFILASALVESFGMALLMPLLDAISGTQSNALWSRLVHHFVSQHFAPHHLLLGVSVLFLVCLFLKVSLVFLRIYWENRFIHGLRAHWIDVIKHNYMYAPFGELLNHKQGLLIHNTVQEPAQACKAMLGIIELSAKLCLIAGLYIVLLTTSWKITLFLTASAGFLILFTNKTSRNYSLRFGKERMALEQEIHAMTAEDISGARQIKTFGLEKTLLDRFESKIRVLKHIVVRNSLINQLPLSVAELFMGIASISVLLYLNYRMNYAMKDVISLVGLFAVVSHRLTFNLSELFAHRMRVVALLPSLALIRHLCGQALGQEELYRGKPMLKLSGDIRFENVSFSYTNKVKVLNDFNLTIRHNQMTALVGPSGIGKSTVADLLLGLYQPSAGRITIGSENLKDVQLASWRHLIGFVSQDVFIFNTTILENIRFGLTDATDAQVLEAAKMACAHNFIEELPGGYQTVVGDRGLRLSGGQRQRIALARALIRNPDLLIFDEATSALDHETEQAVKASIEALSTKKTILIIAHRLTTIEKADAVYDFLKQDLITTPMQERAL